MHAISLDWYPAGIVFPAHAHDFSSASIILIGGLTERVGSRSEEGGPGTLIRKTAGTIHTNRFADVPTLLLSISVHPARADLTPWSWSASREAAALGWQLAASLVDRTSWCDERTEELVALALSARKSQKRPMSRNQHLVDRVRDRIRDSAPAQVSVEAIARDIDMHPAHLVRLFRGHFGCTPATYARIVRVERAMSLLVSRPGMRVSEVAYATGFADESHLCRVFSRQLGVRPTAVRRFSASALAAFSRMFKSSN